STVLLCYLLSFPTRRSSDLPRKYGRRVPPTAFCYPSCSPACSLFRYPSAFSSFFLRLTMTMPAQIKNSAARFFQDRKRSPRKIRSEEHTSELQSRFELVCRL